MKRKYTPRRKPSRDFVRESGKSVAELIKIIEKSPSLRQAAKTIGTSRDSLLKFIKTHNVVHPKERKLKLRKTNDLITKLTKLPKLNSLNIFLTGTKRMHSKAFRNYRLDLTSDLKYVIITAILTTGTKFIDKYKVNEFLDYFKGENNGE